jgi:hypothetical protein
MPGKHHCHADPLALGTVRFDSHPQSKVLDFLSDHIGRLAAGLFGGDHLQYIVVVPMIILLC